MRCRRPSPPDASSVSRFHEALHYGQADVVRRMVYRNPSLANARSNSSPHATSLMVSATNHQTSLKNTLTLVKLLLVKGASLRTKDDHRCNVLMAVCASGAHPNIVKCLLDWDDENSKHKILLWSEQDDQGRTALGLACFHGYGRLASFIMVIMESEDQVGANSPLYALNMALKSGDERCVLELLRNRKLRWVVREDHQKGKLTVHGEWNPIQRMEEQVTVASCVAKAVELDMVQVVRDMHRLNRRTVGHATWFALCTNRDICEGRKTAVVRTPVPVRPGFDEIADLHRRDCVWERMKLVFLIRYAPDRSMKQRDSMQLNVVAELPDAVFRIVVEFLKPKFDDAEEAQKERFKAVLDISSW